MNSMTAPSHERRSSGRHIADSRNNRAWSPAFRDLAEGVGRWELWGLMAWNDIRLRYRRSVIGPFWLTISMAVTVTAIGGIYSALFGMSAQDYVPYLAAGLIVWTFINVLLSEGCQLFVVSEGVLKHQRIPSTVFLWRCLLRNVIIFSHQLPVYVAAAAVFGVGVGWASLLIIPGFLLACCCLVPLVLTCGILCVRFRDLQLIVANVLQVLFFVTPVIWKPQGRGTITEAAALLNPLAHVLTLVRSPLMGEPGPQLSWVIVAALACVGNLLAFALYARVRTRITYWL
ncbi:MAG: ABC transporter permease [Candidatus Competibacteraceae bacterium]|nr:ABC transporter permease [Candidatus Competibacteraceae bacterium]